MKNAVGHILIDEEIEINGERKLEEHFESEVSKEGALPERPENQVNNNNAPVIGNKLNDIEASSGLPLTLSSNFIEDDESDELSRIDSFIEEYRFSSLNQIGPIGSTGLEFEVRSFSRPQLHTFNINSIVKNFSFPHSVSKSFINEDALTLSLPLPQNFADEIPSILPNVVSTPEPAPLQEEVENLGAVQVFSRVSNATINQNMINSYDGYDLDVVRYKKSTRVNGDDLDIGSVKDTSSIVYKYKNANTLVAKLKSEWNSVKNIEVESDGEANVTLINFVHTDVSLNGEENSRVVIRDAKRGNIETGDGDDVIHVRALTNGSGWSNLFDIDAGAGADKITLLGDGGHTIFYVDAGAGNDRVVVKKDYSHSDIDLGAGDDVFRGGSFIDVIQGGDGDDNIRVGLGNDVIYGDVMTLPQVMLEQMSVTYEWVASQAAYKNTIGFYEIGTDGTIDNVQIVYANMKSSDRSDQVYTYGEEAELQNFIVANGFNVNGFYSDMDMSAGNLSFVYDYGQDGERLAKVSDDADFISLVYDDGENAAVLKGHVFHQNESLNKDGKDHVQVQELDENSFQYGFEDLYNLGDQDFRDVVVDVTAENSYETVYSDDGLGGDDKLYGGQGDDLIIGGSGDDYIHGGQGLDIAIYFGSIDEYSITLQGGKYIIEDQVDGRDGIDIVKGVEGILFGVEDLFLDIVETMSESELLSNFGVSNYEDMDLSMILEDYDLVDEAIGDFVANVQNDADYTQTIEDISGFMIVSPLEAENMQDSIVL